MDLEILAVGDHWIASDSEWQHKMEVLAAGHKHLGWLLINRRHHWFQLKVELSAFIQRLWKSPSPGKVNISRVLGKSRLQDHNRLHVNEVQATGLRFERKKRKIKIRAHSPLWKYSLSLSATHPQTGWASREFKGIWDQTVLILWITLKIMPASEDKYRACQLKKQPSLLTCSPRSLRCSWSPSLLRIQLPKGSWLQPLFHSPTAPSGAVSSQPGNANAPTIQLTVFIHQLH